jgi:hypothetical protein
MAWVFWPSSSLVSSKVIFDWLTIAGIVLLVGAAVYIILSRQK